jgi:predicted  nucleic acid-binding Zn-ribbon protein
MSPDLERLIKLQQLESTIADAASTIALHPQRVAELDARLNDARQLVEAARERLKANQNARRDIEKEVATYQGRLTKFKDQLSAVKTNREYQAMQHEIATAESDLGAVEERMLERMLEADELTAKVAHADAELAKQSKAIEAEKATMSQEMVTVERSLAEATVARDALVAQTDPQLVALFDHVARARKGVAISTATRDGLCSVCHVRLRPSVFQHVRQNDSIVQCESCQRVLYWVPPPAPVEPPVTRPS